jgi:putative intracellular protease/amidase
MLIALVVYDGVLDDECEAFRSVLGLVFDAHVVTVGAHHGDYAGVGGIQHVDATFDEIDSAEVVIVPGGLGCERAADDPDLRRFLHRMERTARFVAGSSTGTVVLASAGLLHGEAAATHWLAADLLRRYGSESDSRRLVVTGNVITCEGRISAVEAAFTLVERIEGPSAVERIRAQLIERGQPLLHPPSRWTRLSGRIRNGIERRRRPVQTVAGSGRLDTVRTNTPDDRPTPIQPPVDQPAPPVTPMSVMIELVDNDELKRQMKRRSHRRHRRLPGT